MCSSRRTPCCVSTATRRSQRDAAAEELRNAVRPTQIQMRVVLPGDADTTEHLDAVLGVGLGEFDARGRRDGSGDRQLRIVGVIGCAGRVTCGHRDLLGAQQHLRAHVLDRLEAADRLAELLANLRVFGGGLQCPSRQPGGLGGLHRRGKVLDASPRYGKYLGGGVGEHDPGQWTGEVGRRQRLTVTPSAVASTRRKSSPAGSSSTPSASAPSTYSAVPETRPPS